MRQGGKANRFVISKQLVWEAYKKVKANKGAAGVDEQSLMEFETDLQGSLYKILRRCSRRLFRSAADGR